MKISSPVYRYIAAVCLLTCLVGVSACRTITTQANVPASGPVDGLLFYYLPIGKITIQGSAPIITAADGAKPKSKQSKEDKGAANNASVSESNEERDVAPKLAAAPPEQKPVEDGGGSTPSAISGGDVTINLTAEIEADEGAGAFYVRARSNYMYEDDVHVSAKKHLLSTGNVTTEDKTADIVGAIASTARTALTMARGAPPEQSPSFAFSFYPNNADDVAAVASELQRRGIILSVAANGEKVTRRSAVHVPSGPEMNNLKQSAKLFTEDGSPGLLFRPAASYKISLISADQKSKGLGINVTRQFILPDPTRLYVMKYDRMAFVKKVREIGFTDGMLTEFHEKTPSPILGFLGIPKAILQAIVPIPGAPASTGSASTSGTSAPKS